MASAGVLARPRPAHGPLGEAPAPTSAAASATAPPLLEVSGLTLQYRTPARVVTATWRIDLDVCEGDRLVLLGASGCGKSSLLKAVAGFLAPVEGEIRLAGRPVTGPGPDRVVVFQEFEQLLPWRTVRDNVAFPLRVARGLGRAEARAKADDQLARVGLAGFADSYPHTLSGGMKQRAAIARAMAAEPAMLLMDEPFAALDALTRRRMQEELLALWRRMERCTVLFVTHSTEEALLLGSRVVVLSPHPGRVVADIDTAPLAGMLPEDGPFRLMARKLGALLTRIGEEASSPAREAA